MESTRELEVKAVKWKAILDNSLRILVIVVTVAVFSLIYFTTSTLVSVQQISKQNNVLSKTIIEDNSRLIDCTTPGYPCYERSRGDTGKAIQILNSVTKAAVICADRPGVITQKEMESCIRSLVPSTDLSK